MIRYENTILLDYPPTNPYDWQGHTSSDGHIAPAQKQTHLMCSSLSTKLPIH